LRATKSSSDQSAIAAGEAGNHFAGIARFLGDRLPLEAARMGPVLRSQTYIEGISVSYLRVLAGTILD
jgi:hypothetical protein